MTKEQAMATDQIASGQISPEWEEEYNSNYAAGYIYKQSPVSGRTVREGDRFGYDYALSTREATVRLSAEYRSDRLRADVALALGDAVVLRRGYYEKELFPGTQSLGRSPYTVKALVGWAFSPRSYLEASAAAGAAVPDAADLFYQPLYNNRTVDDPAAGRFYAAELNFTRTGERLSLRITAFAVATLDGIQSRRYYDDMAGVYSDMAVTGIGRMACGVEAAADLRLAYRWSLSLAASGGRYKYIRNPRVTVISDVDNSAVDTRAESYMGGCTLGAAPQVTACAELSYFGPGMGVPRLGGICGAALRRACAPAPYGAHRAAGRHYTGGVRCLYAPGASRRCLHARRLAFQILLFRPFAADRFAHAAQPAGRCRYGLQRLRVAARPAYPFGRRPLFRTPRHALYLCLSAFVLPYSLL
jgi:hypothetical protein